MRLRFLLDENVPRSVLRVLKRKGFDAVEVTDLKPAGLRNSEVAELAVKESRFIVTLDSDFLRLRREMLEKLKVIFINVHPRDPSRIAVTEGGWDTESERRLPRISPLSPHKLFVEKVRMSL